MEQLVKIGNTVRIFNGVTGTANCLDAGKHYLLKVDKQGFYLVEKQGFSMPKKLYGVSNEEIKRWKKSAEINTAKNLGILLNGLKGSGKTIDAQKFCLEMGLPVISMQQGFEGAEFVDFITNPIWGNFILFLDEYEKMYSPDQYGEGANLPHPKDLLTIMDGNFATRIIFLMTTNKKTISEYMTNRLNRIKFRKDYNGLSNDIIDEVLEDLLDNKEHKESVFKLFKKLQMKTFDLLINIIKEMNLFQEDALTCAKYLNLETENTKFDIYEVYTNAEGHECRHLCNSIEFTPEMLKENRDPIYIYRKGDYLPPRGNSAKEKELAKKYEHRSHEYAVVHRSTVRYEYPFSNLEVTETKEGYLIKDTLQGYTFELVPKPSYSSLVF